MFAAAPPLECPSFRDDVPDGVADTQFAYWDRRDPRSIVAFLEAGANVCVVAPGTAGLASHIRALAAHRPGPVTSEAAIPA